MVDQPLIEQDERLIDETIIAEDIDFATYLERFGEFRTEWIQGTIIKHMANNLQHQIILTFLTTLINFYLGFKQVGRLLVAGYAMYRGDDHAAREPDLLVILDENSDKMKSNHLDGVADLAIEIVSPESTRRDRGIKFAEYESAGVKEYCLIDPIRSEAFIYVLDNAGNYHAQKANDAGETASSVLPGLYIHPDWLWTENPPQGETLTTLVDKMVQPD